MYKALNYWVYGGFAGDKTPYEFIDYAAEKKLDGIELTVGDAIKVDITREECEKIAAYAKSRNVGLRTLATGMYGAMSLGADDETERRNAIDFTKKYLQIANWLGVPTILVVPGSTCVAWEPSRPVVAYKTVWEKSTESIKELLPVAEELNVTIALENVWTRFLFSPMEWKFFVDQFNSERIGVYFDVGNCCLYCRPQDYVEVLENRIKAVHLKNFAGNDCGGGLHGFGEDLLSGEVDFKAVFAAFDKIGYNGTYTVEMIPFSRLPEAPVPDVALADVTVEKLHSL